MANGFAGNAPRKFMTTVHKAVSEANSTWRSEAAVGRVDAYPRKLPFDPRDGNRGSFILGRGSSANIVADSRTYEQIARGLYSADDQMGQCIFRVSTAIEAMCDTIFILPRTNAQCRRVTETLKNALNQYQDLSDELIRLTRNYGREIVSIGE